MSLELRVYDALEKVPREAWDALHTESDSPFLYWDWLVGLERTRCVHADTGWQPLHLTLWRDGLLVAAAPAYVKGHSEGEFVFDYAWARAAQQFGLEYYPKLLLAVPFTPATGSRLLRAPGEDLAEVAQRIAEGARALSAKLGLSGAHVLFPHEKESAALCQHGFAERWGVQFHWSNDGYGRYDDFLARFNAKRRAALKRERAQAAKDGLELTTHTGPTLTRALVDPMFHFYTSTVDKFYWGRRYLNKPFFEWCVERMPERLRWVLARDSSGEPVAGAFNAERGGVLYGRYWGASREYPFLHFNVCFYHSIEECIARGYRTFEPGAGGEHKLARGFLPTLTRSAHWLASPGLRRAVEDFLRRERDALGQALEKERSESPLRAPREP